MTHHGASFCSYCLPFIPLPPPPHFKRVDNVCVAYLPVEAPMAPIRTEGTAMTKQPKAARKERT